MIALVGRLHLKRDSVVSYIPEGLTTLRVGLYGGEDLRSGQDNLESELHQALAEVGLNETPLALEISSNMAGYHEADLIVYYPPVEVPSVAGIDAELAVQEYNKLLIELTQAFAQMAKDLDLLVGADSSEK